MRWTSVVVSAALCVAPFKVNAFVTPTKTSSSSSTTALRDVEDATAESSSSSSSSSSLPDFGKTTIEVDKIKLEPKKQQWRRKDLFGSSLVEQTKLELLDDEDFQSTQQKMKTIGPEGMSKEERTQRRRALDNLGVPSFTRFLKEQGQKQKNNSNEEKDMESFKMKRKLPTILQVNIGLYCNQACGHCHVESSPLRTEEMMTADTAARCLELLKNTPTITTLDITGGAPELNENFRFLVKMAREIRPDLEIIDRCNLTVLQEPGQEDLVDFLKDQKVHIIASLPCYSEENVDTQRGYVCFAFEDVNAIVEGHCGTSQSVVKYYSLISTF